MARDMTVFVDNDQKAYLFSASEGNPTLQISELTDDYLQTTGKFTRRQTRDSVAGTMVAEMVPVGREWVTSIRRDGGRVISWINGRFSGRQVKCKTSARLGCWRDFPQ